MGARGKIAWVGVAVLAMAAGMEVRGARAGDEGTNADDFKCGPIDCDVCKEHPERRFADFKGDALDRIAELRAKFWETYPKGEKHQETREQFAQALFMKDMLILQAYLAMSIGNPQAGPLNRGHDIPAKAAALMAGAVDDGIPQTARYEFFLWAESVRDTLGDVKGGTDGAAIGGFTAGAGVVTERFRKACNPSGKQYQAYVMERDWAEFLKAKRIPAGFNSKERYGIYLYMRQALLPHAEATAALEGMKDALGTKVVEDAAEWVRRQPKKENGDLTVTIPPPLKKGPTGDMVEDYDAAYPDFIEGVYRDPLVAFQNAATWNDPHRYTLYQITMLYHSQRKLMKGTTNRWTWAKEAYAGLENAFGGREKLRFAEEGVWKAKKRLVTGAVMGEKQLGATRQMPWEVFEEMLCRKYPEGYARAAIAFQKDFDHPASVDMEKEFKALANGNEKGLVEAARRLAGRKPNLFTPYELDVLKREFASPTQDVVRATGPMEDYPEYWAWKGFPAGSQVMYAQRYWTNKGDKMVAGFVTYKYGYTLKAMRPEQLDIWFSEQIFDSRGTAHPSRDREEAYPPQVLVSTRARGGVVPEGKRELAAISLGQTLSAPNEAKAGEVQSGEEVLEVAGRRIKTQWRAVTYSFSDGYYKDGKSTVKVWWSDAIPGKLVRKTVDNLLPPADRKPMWSRAVEETWIESVKGFEPGEKGSGKDTAYEPVAMEIPGLKRWEQPAAKPVIKAEPAPAAAAAAPPRGQDQEQMKLLQRYRAAMTKGWTARAQAKMLEGTAGAAKLPEKVQTACDAVQTEIMDASKAMGKHDNAELEKAVKALEESAEVMEAYVKENGGGKRR